MSLTSEQKKDIKQLGKVLRDFERTAMENSIDLDVFMTGYSEDGIQLYATERILPNPGAGKRKQIFEKQSAQSKKVNHD